MTFPPTMIVYPDENYNSWVSAENADAYFATRLNADDWWALEADYLKEQALQSAFGTLDELSYTIVLDEDRLIDANYYSAEQAALILGILQKAQCEQARHEMKGDFDGSNPESISLGGILSVKFGKTATLPDRFSERTLALLRPYLRAKSVTRYR